MNQFILSELDFFLASFAGGMFLFLAYDILKVFRNIIKHAKILTAVEDILFWTSAGIFMFYVCFQFNDGILRWYAAAAFLIGMKLYQILFSKLFLKCFTFLLLKIKKAVLKVISLLLSPVKFIWSQIRRFYHFLKKRMQRRYRIIGTRIKKQLKIRADTYRIKRESKKKKHPEKGIEQPPKIPRGVLELIPRNIGDLNETEIKKKKKKA